MSNGLIICIAVLGFLAVSLICTTIEKVMTYKYYCDCTKTSEVSENDTKER